MKSYLHRIATGRKGRRKLPILQRHFCSIGLIQNYELGTETLKFL